MTLKTAAFEKALAAGIAAYEAASKERMSSEWIQWEGGKCPTAEKVLVWLREESEEEAANEAHADYGTEWDWSVDNNNKCGGDIIAYRILPDTVL